MKTLLMIMGFGIISSVAHAKTVCSNVNRVEIVPFSVVEVVFNDNFTQADINYASTSTGYLKVIESETITVQDEKNLGFVYGESESGTRIRLDKVSMKIDARLDKTHSNRTVILSCN